jgi:hypothetical protein
LAGADVKSVLTLALPEVMSDDSDLVKTLENMIENQMSAERQVPYFIVTYVLFADYKFSHNDRDGALQTLLDGERNVVKQPVKFKYLNDYFCMPFKDFLKRLVRSNEYEIAQKLSELGKIYFPNEEDFNHLIK